MLIVWCMWLLVIVSLTSAGGFLHNPGTALGRLVLHRPSWFNKDIDLCQGSGTAVTAVAWRGDVVAWSDASQVRLMDVHAQVAICYLNR